MTSKSTAHCCLHDGLRATDALVAKALGISELSQAAKIETRSRDLLSAEWDKLADQAVRTALAELKKGKGDVTDAEIDRIERVVARTMEQWPGRVTERYLKSLDEIYELAHIAAARKAYGLTNAKMDFSTPIQKAELAPVIKPSFDTVDKNALKALKKRQTIWIGNHYSDNVSRTVRETVRSTVIENGRDRAAAGLALRSAMHNTLGKVDIPRGFQGSSYSYFEGLAAHGATTARVQSQLNVFKRTGYTKYEVVNPQDHRTCAICQRLDGHVFYVQDGMEQMSKLSAAKTPDAVKSANPYLTRKDSAKLASGPKGSVKSTRGLVARGNAMPPYHYKCRCNIDVIDKEEPPVPEEPTKPVKPGKPPTIRVPKKPLAPRPESAIPLRPESHAALKKDMTGLSNTWTKAWEGDRDFKKFRKETEAFLQKHWGISKFAGRSTSRVASKEMLIDHGTLLRKNHAGHHAWDGLVVVRASRAEQIGDGLANAMIQRGVSDAQPGLKTVIHEFIHGADRMTAAAYVRGGAVVTEATTELAARRVVLDMRGKFGKRAATSFPNTGSYSKEIKDVHFHVKYITNWDDKRVMAEVERASVLMHSKATKEVAKSARGVTYNFVENLPGKAELTQAQQIHLAARLEQMEARFLK